jgi:hypothetical protein
MMRIAKMLVGLTILAAACGGLSGCSSEPPGTDAQIKPTPTPEEIKAGQAKLKEGMKTGGGMYKGAPGAPGPK